MTARIQRILAAIELFALVLWVGGLFFFTAFLQPLAGFLVASPQQASWQALDTAFAQFNSVEIIFALVILISNFLKAAFYRKLYALQQAALMVASLMLVLALTCSFVVRPRLETKMTLVFSDPHAPRQRQKQEFEERYREYRTLMAANFLLGLFMVYSYRAFEERKYQALLKVMNLP